MASEIEVNKAQMDALKALSDTNLKVSEARNRLIDLQAREVEYLESREKKVLERVEKALVESQVLTDQTIKNYDAVREYLAEVRNAAHAVTLTTDLILERDRQFDERVSKWEVHCNTQEAQLAEHKKVLQSQYVLLHSEKESIDRQKKLLGEQTRKIEADRATISNAIKRLKEGRT